MSRDILTLLYKKDPKEYEDVAKEQRGEETKKLTLKERKAQKFQNCSWMNLPSIN